MSKPRVKATKGIREKMFQDYCNEASLGAIAKRYGYCKKTIGRYRQIDRWNVRKQEVHRRLEAESNDSALQMMKRQAEEVRGVMVKALSKVLEDGFKNPKDAADAFFKALEQERTILGQPSTRSEVTVVEEIKRRYANRHKA